MQKPDSDRHYIPSERKTTWSCCSPYQFSACARRCASRVLWSLCLIIGHNAIQSLQNRRLTSIIISIPKNDTKLMHYALSVSDINLAFRLEWNFSFRGSRASQFLSFWSKRRRPAYSAKWWRQFREGVDIDSVSLLWQGSQFTLRKYYCSLARTDSYLCFRSRGLPLSVV